VIVGLTGGIGSGKSAAADLFAAKGVELVDTDVLAREVVELGTPALAAIAEHFGDEILGADGGLDRAKLRAIVFAQPAEKNWLEALLHPLINELLRSRLASFQSSYCLLVSPLLLETEQAAHVDRILVIDIDRQGQLQRTLRRDGSSQATVEAIIDSQISREERLARADDIISNQGTLEDLARAVDQQHARYLQLSETTA
jgi:dephospho-CoA kinase